MNKVSLCGKSIKYVTSQPLFLFFVLGVLNTPDRCAGFVPVAREEVLRMLGLA